MNNTTPPAVVHSLNCTCARCREERAAEVRRRIEDARREEQRGRELAHFEAMPLVKVRRPQPGTLAALRKLGGAR